MSVIDTHCHIDLVDEQGIPAHEALRNAGAAGVEAWIQIATNLRSAEFNRDFASRCATARASLDAAGTDAPAAPHQRVPAVYWTAGLHPEAADDLSQLDDLLRLIRAHRDDPYFVGVGETGLDYFHTTEHVTNQRTSLERHLAIAQELGLPIVLHLRDERAYNPDNVKTADDALAILRNFPGVRGVLHCFTYTEREALPFVELGWFVSYSGILTFKAATAIQQGAGRLPLDRLLVETDAPYLAPNPHRGQTNQPAYVTHTLEFLARLRAERCGEDAEEVRATILANSRRFIALKESLPIRESHA